jgi:hypothetical protein
MGEYLNWSYETYWVRKKHRELEVCLIGTMKRKLYIYEKIIMKLQEFQKGNNSKLTSMERLELHTLWLEQLHSEINQSIIENKLKNIEVIPIQGFPKDNDKF